MPKQSILVYTPKITPRIEYTFKQVLTEMLGIDIVLTTDKDFFSASPDIKINYSQTDWGQGIFFYATELLLQDSIIEHEPEVFYFDNIPVFYKTEASTLPFDPFASTFFMLSRYEEYYNKAKDQHGRYKFSNSLAHKHNFIEQPVINQWVEIIKTSIKKNYPKLQFKAKDFSFNVTIDIDIAYAHKHKGFVRAIGAIAMLFFTGQWGILAGRLKTLAGLKQDPFDTYTKVFDLKNKYNFNLIFFLLLANRSKYDRNLSWKNKGFRKLIQRLNKNAETGIHLSYQSNNNIELKEIEIKRLANITSNKVEKNRQHFLRMSLPESYQDLIKLGIQHDYTMGYAEAPGFRAGICTPFKFYDLQKEQETSLTIHPFAFMDGSFIDYQKMGADESWPKIKQLIEHARNVNGAFYSLWHNHSLCGASVWKGWDKTFEKMIKYSDNNNG